MLRPSDCQTDQFAGLNFEEKLEFNEGDVGMAGGMQILGLTHSGFP